MTDTNQEQSAQDEVLSAEQSIGGELEKLRAEAAEARDRALRATAELENYRKRAKREMDDERRYANLPLLSDLLPVIDNVGRAITAGETATDAKSVVAGFKMVAQQLEQVLTRHSCTKIEALNEPFDPHKHQAILQQPSDKVPPNTVLMVAQEGYQLHDRVLRPAQVIVATAAPSES
jgi:molecular chaperone GrpE